MSVPQPNPYQPPQAAGEWAAPLEPPGRPRLVWAMLLGLLGGLPYAGFVLMLVRTGGTDRLAGFMLAGNLLFTLVVAIWELIRHRSVWCSYGGMIAGQLLILAGMLVSGFGNVVPVLTINVIIIAIAAGLGGVSWGIARRTKLSDR